MKSADFIAAIQAGDLARVKAVPKTDLHNHGSLGFPLSVLQARSAIPIPASPEIMHTFAEFAEYLKILQEHLYTVDGFAPSIDDAMRTAKEDGVTELELSIDSQVLPIFGSAGVIVDLMKVIEARYPSVTFRADVGINREWDHARVDAWVVPLIESGYFQGIDLYGNELFGEPEKFVSCYRLARNMGMRCKGHAGEYLDAEFVRRSVEVLELDEVQHGISAAQSPEVMRWLADHDIRLNICPTSNVRLARVPAIARHPIRKLYDAGIHVTLNSDDILVFNKTVSEEYLLLHEHGVFTAEELDDIRVRGFRT